MKYNHHRKKLITESIPARPCTQVWKLVKKIIPLIRDQISKNPGNGKTVAIWEDRIMRRDPLYLKWDLRGLHCWMEEIRINTLYSIYEWDHDNWLEWKLPTIPKMLLNGRN